jgi:hypothetical protein
MGRNQKSYQIFNILYLAEGPVLRSTPGRGDRDRAFLRLDRQRLERAHDRLRPAGAGRLLEGAADGQTGDEDHSQDSEAERPAQKAAARRPTRPATIADARRLVPPDGHGR